MTGVTQCSVTTPTTGTGDYSFEGAITDGCSSDIDTDGDGLLDSWEVAYFGNLTSQNGAGDFDGDGLTNVLEYRWGTNPTVADYDSDGLTDGVEVANGYNPTVFDSNGNGVGDGYEDYDGDGLANLMEGEFGLNPWSFDDVNANSIADWKEDTDGDGLPDAYERNISLTSPTVVEAAPVLPNPLDKCPVIP
jgi:hypothetical protein